MPASTGSRQALGVDLGDVRGLKVVLGRPKRPNHTNCPPPLQKIGKISTVILDSNADVILKVKYVKKKSLSFLTVAVCLCGKECKLVFHLERRGCRNILLKGRENLESFVAFPRTN